MVSLKEPFTFENSSNPWLMDQRDDSGVLVLNGMKMSAANLWKMSAVERKAALEAVFQHYRANGFPKIALSSSELAKEFSKLKRFKVEDALTKDGFVSNSGVCCIDVCKHFCQDEYYRAKGGPKTKSVREVFEDDELFRRVLKNRMGWNTSREGGAERPYLFPVSDKQILNGIRNSGLGYGVSNFRPTIAKWAYAHAAELAGKKDGARVFDYSAGWGARALGALSLGFSYDATDPLTSADVRKCCEAFANGLEFHVFDKCSEDSFFKSDAFRCKYDVVGSCPPYFDLETYSDGDEKQSVVSCKSYSEWLKKYWKGTVENCAFMLKDGGVFFLVMKDEVDGFQIRKDMEDVLRESGLAELEAFQYKTTTNHLSRKTETGRTSKTNEWVTFFKLARRK